jgi:hypothetical protein
MAVTLESFVERFPEFEKASASQVEAVLAEARLQIDSEVWGDKTDLGVNYLTAHLLALSPFGRNARLAKNDRESTYGTHYHNLQLQVHSGFRVI